jgi:hypothetical protein
MSQDLDTPGHLLKAITDVYPERSPPFKTIKLKGIEEFLLAGARLGNRQPVILKLTPMDAVDYEAVELESDKVSQFPALKKHLVDHLGGYLNLLQSEAGAGLDAAFIPSGVSLNAAIITFNRAVPELLDSLKANRIAKAEREAALAYADNETWGTW